MKENEIDWKKLRERIAEGPIFPLVKENKNQKTKGKTPEEIQEFKQKEHDRQKKWREEHPEKCRELQRDWAHRNPDKVKAKRKRNYDAHKDDPEWRNHRVEKQRAFMERLKADPVRYELFKQKKREYKQRKKLEKQQSNKSIYDDIPPESLDFDSHFGTHGNLES